MMKHIAFFETTQAEESFLRKRLAKTYRLPNSRKRMPCPSLFTPLSRKN